MHFSHMVRLYPDASQREAIDETIDAGRWSYNQALAERKAAYEATGKSPSTADMVKRIPTWKREHPWLAAADSMALQQAVRDNGRAFENFFRRCKSGDGRPGYPRFKSKRDRVQSYRTQNPTGRETIAVIDARHVKLPKLGAVKARVTKDVPGRITSATVKRTATGKYLCVLLFEVPDGEFERWPMPEGAPEVTGVDMGVSELMTLSDGRSFENPRALAKLERKLAREQRRLSRKRKGSANREKQRARVARVHERIDDARRDALHKATTEAARESQAVAAEDLNVEGMRRNRHLAKAVSDASMGAALRMLEYKCARNGRAFVKVSRWYPSSKTCSACGHVLDELPLSVREWECPACGARHGRDLNAARNIAAEGLRILRGNGTAGLAGTPA